MLQERFPIAALLLLLAGEISAMAADAPAIELPAAASRKINFDSDILPIFEERCTDCHGLDDPEAGFRILSRKSLLRGGESGEPAIIPARSAESFIEIVKKYALYPLMTGSKVMCISKKVADIFTIKNWKKVKVFNPGDEILQLEEKN